MNRLFRPLFALLVTLIALALSAPAQAISLQFAPASLALSPGGPYSSARDKPVGTVIATASSTLSATDISALGCAVTALMLSGSPANGNTFTTGVSGLGINLYFTDGGSRIQITPGIQASIVANLGGSGTVTTIEADLVVTGQVGSGTLTTLPSVTVTFAAVGLGCGVLNLGLKTLTVTATDGTVTGLSCTVITPSLSVSLPRVSAAGLASPGTTAGATRLRVGLNCASAGTNVYVTFTDANNAANRTTNLALGGSSTATGVAIQLLRDDGSLVAYGPDSSAGGNANQFLVGPSLTVTGIPLTARYIATGTAAPGSVNSAATFTLSYQ